MKFLLTAAIAVFSVQGFSQTAQQPAISAKNQPASSTNWSQIGPTVEGSRGFTLHGRGIKINKTGQYELWVRILPVSHSTFIKRYSLPRETATVQQYAIIDCDKKLLSLEKTTLFDASDRAITGRTEGLTPSSSRNAVRPGSIGASIFKFVCEEPTSLPMTQN